MRITPRRVYHEKFFIFNGNFIFQSFSHLTIDTSLWMRAIYMESTEKRPFSFRFHRKTSDPAESWIMVNLTKRASHDASLGPVKSRLKVTFGGEVRIVSGTVSLLWRTILYRAGYWSFRRSLIPWLASLVYFVLRPSSWWSYFRTQWCGCMLRSAGCF